MKQLMILSLIFACLFAHAEPEGFSTDNRKDKHWGWVGQLGNFTSGNVQTFGAGAGLTIFLTTNDLLSIELGYGANYDALSALKGDTVDANTRWAGVYYKRFLTNSFYVKGGFEDTYAHYKVTHNSGAGAAFTQTADLNLFSLFVGIGNQWQWESLTLGCDWIGVVQPFANSGFSETDDGTPNSTWDLKERLTRPGLDIARFYIGMSF